jgi:putative transposase
MLVHERAGAIEAAVEEELALAFGARLCERHAGRPGYCQRSPHIEPLGSGKLSLSRSETQSGRDPG